MSSPHSVTCTPPPDDVYPTEVFVTPPDLTDIEAHWLYDEYTIVVPYRFPLRVVRRIQRLVHLVIPIPHSHKISNIPRFAGWGTNGRSTFLSIRNIPIRISVIGCIMHKFVLQHSRSRVGQSGVEVEFVRDIDHSSMTQLLRHALPEPSEYPPNLTAYKRMGSRMLFPHVFDARSGLSSTAGMNTLSFDALQRGQLVMLDMKFGRRRRIGGGLSVWFDLVSVILLEDLPPEG